MQPIKVNGKTYCKSQGQWFEGHFAAPTLIISDADFCQQLDQVLDLDTQLQPVIERLNELGVDIKVSVQTKPEP